MDIKEIALKVADSLRNKVDGISHMQSNQGLARFAEALIESYKAELLKEVGEPVARTVDRDWISTGEGTWLGRIESHLPLDELKSLYTSDQLAAAIAKATKPLEDQLAKAEQRVAEACAKVCDGCSSEGVIANWKAEYFSKAIRQGEWRKFVKEV